MKVYGRLIAALLVAAGLAGCGVAVDQRTLAPVVAAPPAQTPEADPAAAPTARRQQNPQRPFRMPTSWQLIRRTRDSERDGPRRTVWRR